MKLIVSNLNRLKIVPPELTGIGALLTALQIVLICSQYSLEAGESPTPYSKFACGKKLIGSIPSRYAMLLIYLPAFSFSLYQMISMPIEENLRVKTLINCIIVHFLKRVVEVMFVHKYSGVTSASLSVFIGIYYAFTSWIILHFQGKVKLSDNSMAYHLAGLALFIIGEIGNAYHHFLLSALRKQPNDKSYIAPSGGLFAFVATPHYFFELLAWFGLAVISQQGNAYLVAFSMLSYLAGRSVSTNRWNKKHIQGYRSRKNLIPFIF
jgi:very-long-chain enoyl-CoA reductase